MIKVQSLIQDGNSLVPVDVELALWPGLPMIQFLGLPDQHLKESAMRIKSAIKQSGFQFPKAQQILVNLRPSHLKKTSQGLELAVAAAYLFESGQLKAPLSSQDFFIYGELTLSGEVLEPENLSQFFPNPHQIILTGQGRENSPSRLRRQIIRHLRDLARPVEVAASTTEEIPERPQEWIQRNYSEHQAFLIELLAVGEHSALIAGPSGTGKSTVAQALPSFLEAPTKSEFRNLQKIHSEYGEKLQWRPVVKPHHSTPISAMIGGGAVPFAGEISRAHGGVLILDELFEYSSTVRESLRGPFEEGKMRVYRNGKLKEYPAQAQIIATTNLCPCGAWTPLRAKETSCGFSAYRCKSYERKLSGPLVDRFEILSFSDEIGELSVSGDSILKRVQTAQEFVKSQKRRARASQLSLDEALATATPILRRLLNSESEGSQRRRLAMARVARTLADLDGSEELTRDHVDDAHEISSVHFHLLQRWH